MEYADAITILHQDGTLPTLPLSIQKVGDAASLQEEDSHFNEKDSGQVQTVTEAREAVTPGRTVSDGNMTDSTCLPNGV